MAEFRLSPAAQADLDGIDYGIAVIRILHQRMDSQ